MPRNLRTGSCGVRTVRCSPSLYWVSFLLWCYKIMRVVCQVLREVLLSCNSPLFSTPKGYFGGLIRDFSEVFASPPYKYRQAMYRRAHSRSPILCGHSRSPIRGVHSRSPICDAISLMVDSNLDDDDDKERDDAVLLPNFPLELASTCSSSTKGGGGKAKGGGNDHDIDDDNDVGGQAAPPPPKAVGVDMSSLNKNKKTIQKPLDHNGFNSVIGKWRRSDLYIASSASCQ